MAVSLLRDTPFSWLPVGALFHCYDVAGLHEKISLTAALQGNAVYYFGADDKVRYAGGMVKQTQLTPFEFTFESLTAGQTFKHADFECDLEKIDSLTAMTAYGTVHAIANDCAVSL